MAKQWVVAYGRADMAIGPFDNESVAEKVNAAIGGDGVVELISAQAYGDMVTARLMAAMAPSTEPSIVSTSTGRIPSTHIPPFHELPRSNTPKTDIPPWEA